MVESPLKVDIFTKTHHKQHKVTSHMTVFVTEKRQAKFAEFAVREYRLERPKETSALFDLLIHAHKKGQR